MWYYLSWWKIERSKSKTVEKCSIDLTKSDDWWTKFFLLAKRENSMHYYVKLWIQEMGKYVKVMLAKKDHWNKLGNALYFVSIIIHFTISRFPCVILYVIYEKADYSFRLHNTELSVFRFFIMFSHALPSLSFLFICAVCEYVYLYMKPVDCLTQKLLWCGCCAKA